MQRQRILITGGAGFIGSHLARRLADAGHHVRVLDNFSTQVHGTQPRVPENLGKDVEILHGDVRSHQDLTAALHERDVVFHFAASVGVGQSMYEVRSYIENNNVGTATLLEKLIENPVKKLIVASSMSIYGEGLYESAEGVTQSEVRRSMDQLRARDFEPKDGAGKPLRPVPTPEWKRPELSSIYALSKFDQERMCLMIGQAYRIPTVALRFFNVYGRGQSISNPYTGVMAIFGSRLLNNSAPIIFEDGRQRRDFVHVSDVARACQLAMEVEAASGKSFNIGSGRQVTVLEIARKMAQALGKEHILPEITGQYRVGDIRHCFGSIKLATDVLGYEPRVSLEQGILDLAEWLQGKQAIDRTGQMRMELEQRGLAV